MSSAIQDWLKKLQFPAPKNIYDRAISYYDASFTYNNSTALPLICIHLACNVYNCNAPVSEIMKNITVAPDTYVQKYREVSQRLKIEMPVIVFLKLDLTCRVWKN